MAKDKGKKKGKKDNKKGKSDVVGSPLVSGVEQQGDTGTTENGPAPSMSKKEFEKEMEKLQVELVKMQEWVKANWSEDLCVI